MLKLRSKRPRMERGEQSREETSDGKGRMVEGGGGGDEGISVIGSGDDIRSSADDVILAEELQIQEILFMTLQSEKKWGNNFHLETEQEQVIPGSNNPQLDPTDQKGKQLTEITYSRTDPGQSSRFTIGETPNFKPKPDQSSHIHEAKTFSPKSEPGQSSSLIQADIPCSNPEPGQSSRFVHAETLCKICLEWVPSTQFFTINPCNHLFCNSCMVCYITSQLEENIAYISCPEPGCRSGSLDPLSCQCILHTATFDKWGLVLCESSLGLEKFYCPFKDCSALLVNGGEDVRNCECPHCNRMFCARCKVPWHGEMSCEEFKSLSKDESGQEDFMLRKLASDKMWQRCPKCRIYVEKIDGCMFMHCRCGYGFCYMCATAMSKQTHYCTKCKR